MNTIPAAESLTLITEGDDHLLSANQGGAFHGASAVGRVVANWHDENHAGAYSMCMEQPCHAAKRVDQ